MSLPVGAVREKKVLFTPVDTGPAFWGPGDRYTFLATGAQTGGAYFVMEGLVPPGGGPPSHIHHREEEFYYIIEGTVTVFDGETATRVGPGGFVHIPRETVHHFHNDGPETVRMLLTFAPAGMDEYFIECLEEAHDRHAPVPPVTPELIARMIAAAPAHGMEIVDPSPA
jgi:mannose-6-phosphate isomerase-like protein (cupin superfamily)